MNEPTFWQIFVKHWVNRPQWQDSRICRAVVVLAIVAWVIAHPVIGYLIWGSEGISLLAAVPFTCMFAAGIGMALYGLTSLVIWIWTGVDPPEQRAKGWL